MLDPSRGVESVVSSWRKKKIKIILEISYYFPYVLDSSQQCGNAELVLRAWRLRAHQSAQPPHRLYASTTHSSSRRTILMHFPTHVRRVLVLVRRSATYGRRGTYRDMPRKLLRRDSDSSRPHSAPPTPRVIPTDVVHAHLTSPHLSIEPRYQLPFERLKVSTLPCSISPPCLLMT